MPKKRANSSFSLERNLNYTLEIVFLAIIWYNEAYIIYRRHLYKHLRRTV